MPAHHRSFNPYSSAPPPPASIPEFIISTSSIEPLSDEQAGLLIDSFLQTQEGKVLMLHRLADHLLGRTQAPETDDIQGLENVLEEERKRDQGTTQIPRVD
jgi:hypothetical protein